MYKKMIRPTIIVQITNKCNFGCKFCSASNLKPNTLTSEFVIGLIKRYNPIEINIEGGDPLTISPLIFTKISDYVDQHNLDTELSITSNLWSWYKNQTKWYDVVKRYNICTSFQYGNKRVLLDGTVFGESMFVKIMSTFKDVVNKTPSFIGVVDHDNCCTALDHCLLAKKLETTCSLQRARVGGRNNKAFPYSDMLKIYSNIITNGLYQYEINSRQLYRLITNTPKEQYCSFGVKDCQKRILRFDNMGQQKTCVEMFNPSTVITSRALVCPQCAMCDYVDFCNTCPITKSNLSILNHNALSEHCSMVQTSMDNVRKYVSSLQ